MRIVLFTTLLALSLYPNPTSAKRKERIIHKPPRIVLVQLRAENNRIETLTRQNRPVEVKQVKNEAVQVQRRMIADFTDNFHYCPVFYYMDTNMHKVRTKHFEGVLMNANGTPAPSGILSDTSTSYMIVYYGYPAEQSRSSKKVKDSIRYSYSSGEPFGKGLIINNDLFEQISYFYKLGYENSASKYSYASAKYDIEYYPSAKLFDDKLKGMQKRRRKKITISHANL